MQTVTTTADLLSALDHAVGQSIAIFGAPASGKSHTAQIIFDHLTAKGHKVVILSTDDYLTNLADLGDVTDHEVTYNDNCVIVEGTNVGQIDFDFDIAIEVKATNEVQYAVYASERDAYKYNAAQSLYEQNCKVANTNLAASTKIVFENNADRPSLPIPAAVTINEVVPLGEPILAAQRLASPELLQQVKNQILFCTTKDGTIELVSIEARERLAADAKAVTAVNADNYEYARELLHNCKKAASQAEQIGKELRKPFFDFSGKVKKISDETSAITAPTATNAVGNLAGLVAAHEKAEADRVAAVKAAKEVAQKALIIAQGKAAEYGLKVAKTATIDELTALIIAHEKQIADALEADRQAELQRQQQRDAEAAQLARENAEMQRELAALRAANAIKVETPLNAQNAVVTAQIDNTSDKPKMYKCTFLAEIDTAREIMVFAREIGVIVTLEGAQ